MKPLILTLLAFFCVPGCALTHRQPKGILQLQLVTKVPEVDLMVFSMPDSTKFFSASYQVKYLDEGILQFEQVVNGKYLIDVRGGGNLPNQLDTLIEYKGDDMLVILEF